MLAALARADVDAIVAGGWAVAYAGYPRFSEDIDVIAGADEANLQRLIDVLASFGEGAAAELVTADFLLEEGAVRIMEEDIIDVSAQMTGHTYADLLPLSTVHEVDGQPVRFLSAQGLLLLKGPSLRPRDQADAAALRAILAGLPPDTPSS